MMFHYALGKGKDFVSGQQTDQEPNRNMRSCSNVSSVVGGAPQHVGIAVLIRVSYTHRDWTLEPTPQCPVCADGA